MEGSSLWTVMTLGGRAAKERQVQMVMVVPAQVQVVKVG